MSIFYPIKLFSEWVTYKLLNIYPDSFLGEAVEFFIYDVLKIFILLYILIFAASFIRSYISTNKIHKLLGHKRLYLGHLLATFLGILTPFCTCSAIPLFISFLEAEIPIGITFSFLIASPMINEVALIMLFGLFGVKVALIYAASGIAISFFSGIILGKLKAGKWILKDLLIKNFPSSSKETCACSKKDKVKKKKLWQEKLFNSKQYTQSIFKKIWIYVIIGIGIGAWIHGYVPDDFLVKYADATKWYDVPLAVLMGIPLYSNAAGVIPLINALTDKGLSMGTALAFMMAVTALSLPEFLILKRILKLKLILIFAGIVGVGIMLIGYLFNFIL